MCGVSLLCIGGFILGRGWGGGGVVVLGWVFLVEERKEGNQEICRPTFG